MISMSGSRAVSQLSHILTCRQTLAAIDNRLQELFPAGQSLVARCECAPERPTDQGKYYASVVIKMLSEIDTA